MKPVTGETKEDVAKGNGQMDRLRRQSYLNSRGIKPREQFQLDLIFPDTIGDRKGKRHIPNDYARSSLFTASNKRAPRTSLMRAKLFHYSESISVIYTGSELRAEDDELIWLQILNYGQSVPLGEPFDFSIKDLVVAVGWHKNGRYYDKARECISRLKANEIMVRNESAYGNSGAISLIYKYTTKNDEEGKPVNYRVWIDPGLIVLFAGNTFTSHNWEKYRTLSPVARRLADYVESHKHPYPLPIAKFRDMCASPNKNLRSWRQVVRKACDEIRAAGIAGIANVTDDFIVCSTSLGRV
ncbi:MAG: plasmid replication initiator TrfA [Betaproteobacteria bacterium]|nr:plasmid replication initiator TrfA [Betaproteobacteria bacterium]